MKRRSDELTGRKNKFQVGKSSAWKPQKLRKGRGHTVRWWPERRGKGTRGEDSTITHSVTSPTTGWQRNLMRRESSQGPFASPTKGAKAVGAAIVLQGKGANPAAELQLAQSLSRAAAAVRRAESAVATHGNGSEGAEAAYEEAAVAVNQYLECGCNPTPANWRFKLQRSTFELKRSPSGKRSCQSGSGSLP